MFKSKNAERKMAWQHSVGVGLNHMTASIPDAASVGQPALASETEDCFFVCLITDRTIVAISTVLIV